MNVIENLVEYFKQSANEHLNIEGFVTGEEYEQNHSNRQYPLLWLKFPIQAVASQTQRGDILTLTFNLGVYSNIITDDYGNQIKITEGAVGNVANQISYVGLVPQDLLMEKCFAMLNQVLGKLAYDITEGTFAAILQDYNVANSERYANNDVYGAEASVTLQVSNTYVCSLQTVYPNL